MTVSVSQSAAASTATTSTRWIQLGLGLIAMMSISSPQYVWTLFTKPLQDQLGANLPAIQVTVSILIVLQTWLSPVQGFLVDRFGPRTLIALGCALSGAGWITAAYATTLIQLYLDLRASLRDWHRHRLYRRHRLDGALVPGSARLCDRHGRGRLWVRRDPHHLSDRQHDQELGPSEHADRIRMDLRHRRRRRRPGDAHAQRAGFGPSAPAHGGTPARTWRPARCCARACSGSCS